MKETRNGIIVALTAVGSNIILDVYTDVSTANRLLISIGISVLLSIVLAICIERQNRRQKDQELVRQASDGPGPGSDSR